MFLGDFFPVKRVITSFYLYDIRFSSTFAPTCRHRFQQFQQTTPADRRVCRDPAHPRCHASKHPTTRPHTPSTPPRVGFTCHHLKRACQRIQRVFRRRFSLSRSPPCLGSKLGLSFYFRLTKSRATVQTTSVFYGSCDISLPSLSPPDSIFGQASISTFRYFQTIGDSFTEVPLISCEKLTGTTNYNI